jgi:hypothetical protein
MRATILNVVLFQVGWFACALSAAAAKAWIGLAIALAIILWHLVAGPARRGEWLLILSAALLGMTIDTALMRFGWLGFHSGVLVEGFSPHWMIALWMLFAATLHHSLGWLQRRLVLAGLLGAIAGPLSYWAGTKLGALSISSPDSGLVAIGVAWALALPLLVHLAGFTERRAPRLVAAPRPREV